MSDPTEFVREMEALSQQTEAAVARANSRSLDSRKTYLDRRSLAPSITARIEELRDEQRQRLGDSG